MEQPCKGILEWTNTDFGDAHDSTCMAAQYFNSVYERLRFKEMSVLFNVLSVVMELDMQEHKLFRLAGEDLVRAVENIDRKRGGHYQRSERDDCS